MVLFEVKGTPGLMYTRDCLVDLLWIDGETEITLGPRVRALAEEPTS